MKKGLVTLAAIAVSAVMLGMLVADTQAFEGEGNIKPHQIRKCSEGYAAMSRVVTVRLNCTTGRKAMRAWMGRPASWACPLDGVCRVRTGSRRWLWKCYGTDTGDAEYGVVCYWGRNAHTRHFSTVAFLYRRGG